MRRRDFIPLFVGAAAREIGFVAGMALVLAIHLPSATFAQDGTDRVTGFARDPVHVAAWPAGRKVAVSFALFVEEFGFGQGPILAYPVCYQNRYPTGVWLGGLLGLGGPDKDLSVSPRSSVAVSLSAT